MSAGGVWIAGFAFFEIGVFGFGAVPVGGVGEDSSGKLLDLL
jgi:hypothetical protein